MHLLLRCYSQRRPHSQIAQPKIGKCASVQSHGRAHCSCTSTHTHTHAAILEIRSISRYRLPRRKLCSQLFRSTFSHCSGPHLSENLLIAWPPVARNRIECGAWCHRRRAVCGAQPKSSAELKQFRNYIFTYRILLVMEPE